MYISKECARMCINMNVNLHNGNTGVYIHTCDRVNDIFIHSSMRISAIAERIYKLTLCMCIKMGR